MTNRKRRDILTVLVQLIQFVGGDTMSLLFLLLVGAVIVAVIGIAAVILSRR